MRRFMVILCLLMSAVQLFALEVSTHTVVKGDTLWDIAGSVYQNPWHWPKIYEANKSQISDPNKIYPEQQLTIPDKSLPCPPPPEGFNDDMTPQTESAQETLKPEEPKQTEKAASQSVAAEKVVEPEPVPEVAAVSAPVGSDANVADQQVPAEAQTTVEAVADTVSAAATSEEVVAEEAVAESPAVVKKSSKKMIMSARSYVVSENWEPDGRITGDAEKNLMISAGDTVFINIGSDKVKPGMQCDVVRRIGKVKDPDLRKYIGIEVKRVGIIEVTSQVGDKMSSAKVVTSNDPIEIGDLLKIIESK